MQHENCALAGGYQGDHAQWDDKCGSYWGVAVGKPVHSTNSLGNAYQNGEDPTGFKEAMREGIVN